MNISKWIDHPTFLDKLLFTKHLAVMLKSGIPISEAIESVRDQTTKASFKDVLSGIAQKVGDGQTLADSMKRFPKVFDPLYLGLIKTGEESGNLEANLEFMSGQLKKEYEFRKKIQGAMLYPAIVLTAAGIVGLGVSFYLLPQLAELLKSLDVDLPLSTKILLFVADAFKNYSYLIIASMVGLSVGFKFLITTPFFKPIWHRFLLQAPVFGKFNQNACLTSFCRDLGMMLKSGLPISTAMEYLYDSTTNLVYKGYVKDLKAAVTRGKNLEEELSGLDYKYMPPIVAKMIGVGEKTGNLEESLLYLGDFFDSEVDDASKNLSSVLEPALLLVIGLIVGFMAMAIISPIYKLTGSIKR